MINTVFLNDMKEIHPYDKLYHLLACLVIFMFVKYVLRADNKTALFITISVAVLKEVYDIIWLTMFNDNLFTVKMLYESLSDISVVFLIILASYLLPDYKRTALPSKNVKVIKSIIAYCVCLVGIVISGYAMSSDSTYFVSLWCLGLTIFLSGALLKLL